MDLKESNNSQYELHIISGRTIDERTHGQTVFMAGITKQCSHKKEIEWFYSKAKLKIRKMCATQKGRHTGSYNV